MVLAAAPCVENHFQRRPRDNVLLSGLYPTPGLSRSTIKIEFDPAATCSQLTIRVLARRLCFRSQTNCGLICTTAGT
jgi:hypothetical protein